MNLIALIPTDLQRSRLGLAPRVGNDLAGRSVLARTVERIARVKAVGKIILVHPAGQEPLSVLRGVPLTKPVVGFGDPAGLVDAFTPMWRSARKFAPHAWRGGLGGATCYDELLPAAPLMAALEAHGADAALLAGADWPLVDPAFCQRLAEMHAEAPDAMQLTFTQAPPGLSGIVVGRNLLKQLAENPAAGFGRVLSYVPDRPQADPIGRDVCHQVAGEVRSCARRFIYDTPRAVALIDAVVGDLGDCADRADAGAVTAAATRLDLDSTRFPLPQLVTIELAPDRPVKGPLVPQFHTDLARAPMGLNAAVSLVKQLGKAGDVALSLGGLGDALLHPDWDRVVLAAHEAGVLGICIETDLQCDQASLVKLLGLPVDAVSIRLNADRAATYEKVMGSPDFGRVIENMQLLYKLRAARTEALGVPWMVPRMVKAADTIEEMEMFFDKWMHYLGHAVIEAPTTGGGAMPDLALLAMHPPKRRPCRQVKTRLTVLSNGKAARCDQDWHAAACAGDAGEKPLEDIWRSLDQVRATHERGGWNELELCAGCKEWHRP
jgi:hypothetical protein